jgi:hypothetical protein
LDRSFESTAEPSHPEHEAIFAILQKCRAAKLVEPVGEQHMYYAAMNSKSCRLTPAWKTLLVHGQAGTHMRIDVTGNQDIPPQALEYVTPGISRTFDDLNYDLVGVSSLAAGADQLFAFPG